jgi:hypothetical protein
MSVVTTRLVPRGGRSIADLMAPLEQIVVNSSRLIGNRSASFEIDGETYELPRYVFLGPGGGDDLIRIGLFAGVHGDEPEGVPALIQ